MQTGSDTSLLFFHGGPGFDHRYLAQHFDFLNDEYELKFFDQLGTGGAIPRPADLTFDSLCRHAAEVIDRHTVDAHIRVVAHSFGALVLLGALCYRPNVTVSGLLLNPVPLTAAKFNAMRAALFARIPREILAGLNDFPRSKLAPEQTSAMLQYYIAPGSSPELSALTVDYGVYLDVYDSLNCYDYSALADRFADCHVIVGQDDFISSDMISDIVHSCRSLQVIPNAGHFPFAERPDVFRPIARKLLNSAP